METAGSREKSLQVNSHNRYKNRHLRLILNSKGGLEEEGKKKKDMLEEISPRQVQREGNWQLYLLEVPQIHRKDS